MGRTRTVLQVQPPPVARTGDFLLLLGLWGPSWDLGLKV